MNYSELKEISEAKKVEIKELASALDMTPNGFRESIKNETIQLRKLRTLCDLLRISPSMFFDTTWGAYVNKAQAGDIDNRNREIESLREQLEDKKVIIKMLRDQIDGVNNLGIVAQRIESYNKKGE
jgi:DNA-binding Xre family transcriptional regulator